METRRIEMHTQAITTNTNARMDLLCQPKSYKTLKVRLGIHFRTTMFPSTTDRRSAKDKTGESCEECGKPSLARTERKERLCLLLTAESVYGRSTHSTAQTTAPRHMARTSEDEDSNPRPPAPSSPLLRPRLSGSLATAGFG